MMDATQRKVLVALCDTFFPAISPPPGAAGSDLTPEQEAYFRTSAGAVGSKTPEMVEDVLTHNVPPDVAKEVGMLLSALGSKWGMALIAGMFTPFLSFL